MASTSLANVRDPSVSVSITPVGGKTQFEEEDERRRKRRAAFFWWCCCVGFVLIICIGVGVGVGVGTQDTDAGTASSTKAPTTNGGGGGGGGSPTPPPTTLASRTFNGEQTFFSLQAFNRAKVADMDGDGNDDIIAITKGSAFSPGGAHEGALTIIRHGLTNNVTYLKTCAPTCAPTEDGNVILPDFGPSQRSTFTDINVGDLDGDGKLDILVTKGGINTTVYWKNTGSSGSPSFTATSLGAVLVNTATGGFNGAVFGDFNGDEKLDIVIGGDMNPNPPTLTDNEIRLHLQSAVTNGTFLNHTTIEAFGSAVNYFELKVGDVNEDGKLDLLVARETGSGVFGVKLFLGNGDGTFASATTPVSASSQIVSMSVAQMNSDNHLDLIVGFGNQTVSIFFGDGTGQFNSFTSTSTSIASCFLARAEVFDFDLDGDNDVLLGLEAGLGNGCNPSSIIRTNNGNGVLTTEKSFAEFFVKPGDVLGGDFNGDGKSDIFSFSRPSINVVVLV